MKRRLTLVGGSLLVLVVLLSLVGTGATSSTLFGTRFKVGETIQFKVEDTTTWWWGCCACEDSVVLGWRITNSAGQNVYAVIHDAPVPSSAWQGSWTQMDSLGVAVSAGQYVLYVDTSAGTLSRCFTLYDPCNPWCSSCSSCSCEQVTSITNCSCRTTLVFVDTCTSGCFPLFGWFGSCGSCASPCSSCSSCP